MGTPLLKGLSLRIARNHLISKDQLQFVGLWLVFNLLRLFIEVYHSLITCVCDVPKSFNNDIFGRIQFANYWKKPAFVYSLWKEDRSSYFLYIKELGKPGNEGARVVLTLWDGNRDGGSMQMELCKVINVFYVVECILAVGFTQN